MLLAPALLAPILIFGLGQDDAKKDAEKIVGTWEVASMTAGGREMPEEQTKAIRFTFTKDKLKLSGGAGIGDREFSYKLLTDTKPKGFDTTALDGTFKGKTNPGIYELDGDTLKLCIPNKPDSERPEKLESPQGSTLGLFVLKRVKS